MASSSERHLSTLSVPGIGAYVHALIDTGCIEKGKRIRWDIRPIEFRVCDMPATFDDTSPSQRTARHSSPTSPGCTVGVC
jgi:hypothetical protein